MAPESHWHMAFPYMNGIDMKNAKQAHCNKCKQKLYVETFTIMIAKHVDENGKETDINVLVPVCNMCGTPVLK